MKLISLKDTKSHWFMIIEQNNFDYKDSFKQFLAYLFDKIKDAPFEKDMSDKDILKQCQKFIRPPNSGEKKQLTLPFLSYHIVDIKVLLKKRWIRQWLKKQSINIYFQTLGGGGNFYNKNMPGPEFYDEIWTWEEIKQTINSHNLALHNYWMKKLKTSSNIPAKLWKI